MPASSPPSFPPSRKTGRILVLRGGALGDFILTLPVLAALRQTFPDTALEVMAYPQFASLAVAGGLVDLVKPIESRPLAGFFGRNGDLDFELSIYFASVHLLVSFLYDPDFIFRTNVARISRAQFLQAPHRPDESLAIHAANQLLKPLEQLAIFEADATPELLFPAPNLGPGRWLALHPGSGSERKNWPEIGWQGLLRRLIQQTSLNLCLVGGEAEGDRLARLASTLPQDRCEVWRSRPLPELATRLAECIGFVGHDSGIAHLAAAIGLPGLVLWGPSNAAVWRPRSEQFQVLTAGSHLDRLSLEQVWNVLGQHLPNWQKPREKRRTRVNLLGDDPTKPHE